jgi:hypothetical protein
LEHKNLNPLPTYFENDPLLPPLKSKIVRLAKMKQEGHKIHDNKLQPMKRTGYIIIKISIYLILLGGIADIVYSFAVTPIFPSHLEYLKIPAQDVSLELRNLDLGLIRALGGLIIAMAAGALTLLHISVKTNNKLALWGMTFMVTIGEGNNVLQMFLLDAPLYVVPLFFLLLFWAGVFLWIRADMLT